MKGINLPIRFYKQISSMWGKIVDTWSHNLVKIEICNKNTSILIKDLHIKAYVLRV